MKATLRFLLSGLIALSAVAPLHGAVPPGLQQFTEKYCVDCHDAEAKKGGLNLDALGFGNDAADHAKWVRIFDRVLAGEMPPPKKPRPAVAEQRAFLSQVGQGLMAQHTAMKGTVLRRLNRAEYENTLRDLFGVRINVRDMLPEDSLSHGFDNIGDALGMSDVQLRCYMEAAEAAIEAALQGGTKPTSQTKRYTYAETRNGKSAIEKGQWLLRPDGAVVFFSGATFPSVTLDSLRAPSDGNYRIRITGYAHQSTVPVTFALYTGSFGRGDTEFNGYYDLKPGAPNTVEVNAWLRSGDSLQILAQGLAPGQKLRQQGVDKYDGPGLGIQHVEVEGPVFEQWPPRGYTLLFGDLEATPVGGGGGMKKGRGARQKQQQMEVTSAQPDADAARLLRSFASAAFRRPVTEDKLSPYLALFRAEMKGGGSFHEAMRTAAIAILCAPDFLYLREPAGKLDDYALASRLSYFLWRTMPDAELLRIAGEGKLRQPQILRAQTERLLAHPNAARFTTDFTDGWLDLRNIEFTTPDKQLYPEFDRMLQDSMVNETRAFFDELLRNNLSVSNIIKSDFAMLNARLAEHYGIPGVTGMGIQKVKLPADSKRGGVLTQASILKVSANGANTSPVVRGAWVLDRILGTPPPPPPPGVPGLEPDIRGAKTLRQMLEKHREMESCTGCHKIIDPPGFALENYDVIGGWRERFRSLGEGQPVKSEVDGRKVRYKIGPEVDSSGQLVNGTPFKGFDDFQKLLLSKQDQVTKCVAEKLLTFGSGREIGFSDRNELNAIARNIAAKGGGLRDLLHLVVQSEIFTSK